MATPAPRLKSREVFVHIIFDQGQITVDPPTFWVSKGQDEEVVFHCTSTDPNNPHPDFKVDFNKKNGSPFYESQFWQDCACSGLVKREVEPDEKKLYGYTVTVANDTLDPNGGVKP